MSSAKPKLVAGMLALAVGAGGVGVVAQGPGVAGGQGGGPPLAPGIPQKAAPPAGVAGGPPGGVGSPVGGEGAGGPGIGLGLPGGGPGGVAGMMGGPPQPEKLSVATADRVADPRQRARSQNNIKQILLAMHNHHDAYGFFPTGVKDEQGQLVLSWRVQLLPFIGQENLYKQFKLDEPWDSPANKPLAARMPDIYRAGVEKEAGHTYYQTFSGLGTVCDNSRPIRMADITDGTSNTIAVTEAGPPVPWTKPADLAYSPRKALPAVELPFRNVWHVGMGDGSVRAISPNPDPVVLRAAITRDGGEVYNMDALAAKPSVLDPEERKHVKLLLDELAVLRKQKTELAEQALAMREELMAAKKDAKVAGGPDFQALEEEKGRLLAEVEKLRAELVALRDALTAVKKQ